MSMDSIIARGVMYGSHPPKGVYFIVMIEYTSGHPVIEKLEWGGQIRETTPIHNFPLAIKQADELAAGFVELCPDCRIEEVNSLEHDGYHIYLLKDEDRVARIRIDVHDRRSATLN